MVGRRLVGSCDRAGEAADPHDPEPERDGADESGGAGEATETQDARHRWPPTKPSWPRPLRISRAVLVCPRRAGPRRIVGAVTEPHAVRRLLAALGLAAQPLRGRARPRGLTRARSRPPRGRHRPVCAPHPEGRGRGSPSRTAASLAGPGGAALSFLRMVRGRRGAGEGVRGTGGGGTFQGNPENARRTSFSSRRSASGRGATACSPSMSSPDPLWRPVGLSARQYLRALRGDDDAHIL